MIEQLKWTPLFVMHLDIDRSQGQMIGQVSAGWRGVFPVAGGQFEGARLRGRVNSGGADWVTMRADKSMLIDVRLTLTTHDDAMIGMIYTGVARATAPANDERFMSRDVLPYEDIYVRTTPRFETAAPQYAWLNGVVAVANGMRTDAGGVYHVFEIN